MPDIASPSDLHQRLAALRGAVVAFSGGVDSAVLLHAAVAALGADRVLAVTARSPSLPAAELAACERVAAEIGARLAVVDTDELARDGYRANAPDRCYFCKTELFERIAAVIRGRVAPADWAVLYGAITDDLGDHRPGRRAAAEHGVLAPLADAGFGKTAVRAYARAHGLSVADKPSFACLASRIPYGTEVHAATLARLERAEGVLRNLGFRQFRVRHHDTVARIEVPVDEFERALRQRDAIVAGVRAAGYVYVSLDLAGFRSGSMNEAPWNPADSR